jgi:hypothetical protein
MKIEDCKHKFLRDSDLSGAFRQKIDPDEIIFVLQKRRQSSNEKFSSTFVSPFR